MKKTSFFCLLLLLLAALSAGCRASSQGGEALSRTGFFFNTVIEIRIFDGDAEAALLDDCMALCARYENLLSAQRQGSDVGRINAAAGKAVRVEEETAKLIQTALSYTALSGGRFDITVGALSTLWNFTGDPPGPAPEASEIAACLTHVDAAGVTVSQTPGGYTVTLTDKEARIDLGAVAKGYIADRLKALLLAGGVKSAIINLGGNVLLVGAGEGGRGFKVGVQKPFAQTGVYQAVVAARDASIVTSGVYERYFEEAGVRYHHLLDATTGFPADNGLLSVTIVSGDSLTGDILSTVCFLLGAEDGLKLAEETEGAEALFLCADGTMLTTEGFPLRK